MLFALSLSLLLGATSVASNTAASAISAREAEPIVASSHTVLLVDVAPLGDVSPKLAEKATELLRSELVTADITVEPAAQLVEFREVATNSKQIDLTAARTLLDQGKERFLNLKFASAIQKFSAAETDFEKTLPQTNDFGPLAEAIAYRGASELELHNNDAAQEAFQKLLHFRPTFELDRGTYPPNTLEAFARAKVTATLAPTGTLLISSAPPLATVSINGERRGETPLTLIGVPIGRHAVRLEAAGYLSWSGTVDVTTTGGMVEVRLPPSQIGDDLRALELELRGPGSRTLMTRQAAALARGAKVEAVVVAALSRTARPRNKKEEAGNEMRYLLSVAFVGGDEKTRVVWTSIDRDFLRAQPATHAMIAPLLNQAGPTFISAGSTEPSRGSSDYPSFEARLLGIKPAVDPMRGEEESHSLATRWWFWGALALVGAAAAAGVVAASGGFSSKSKPNETTLTIDKGLLP